MLRDKMICMCFFFQAEDGIRYLVRSRGLGDVYKRQVKNPAEYLGGPGHAPGSGDRFGEIVGDTTGYPDQHGRQIGRPLIERTTASCDQDSGQHNDCLLYTSDAADERSSVDLGGRRIIKKKKIQKHQASTM